MVSSQRTIASILAATDFSDCAASALGWARHLARRHEARLVIHHALAPPQGAPGFPGAVPYPPELHEQYRQSAIERLERSAEEARAEGIDALTDLQVGPAVSTILMGAEKAAADLIVTGTRGLTGIRHLLLGSTAERLVQHSAVPVLAVHPESEPPEQIERVLLPTDFSDDADRALHEAIRLVTADGSEPELLLFHAFHVPVEYLHMAGGFVMTDLTRDALQDGTQALERIAEPLRKAGHTVKVLCREGYAAQAIEIAAEDHDVDLVAMGTHGRSFLPHAVLGSTAERVVQKSPCPVLTLRCAQD